MQGQKKRAALLNGKIDAVIRPRTGEQVKRNRKKKLVRRHDRHRFPPKWLLDSKWLLRGECRMAVGNALRRLWLECVGPHPEELADDLGQPFFGNYVRMADNP